MKALRNTSIAVLACLIVASPATAAPNLTVSVSPTNSIFVSTAVSYTVSGEAEVEGETYQVNISSGTSESECLKSKTEVLRPVQIGKLSFANTGLIPTEDHSSLGTYIVCAMVRCRESCTGPHAYIETSTQFTVVAEPPPLVQPTVPAPPSVQPPVVHVAQHATTISASNKLKVALAKCKKQKNKKKRQKCERQARKKFR